MSTIHTYKRFTHNFKLALIEFLTLIGLSGITHAAFVSVNVNTSVGNNILFDEILASEMRTEADLRLDDSSSIGSATAWAGGSAVGTLRSLTSATMNPPGSFNNSAGIAVAALSDMLTFTVPSGTYDTPLEVTLTGNITGTLSAAGETLFTSSRVDFNASLSALESFSLSVLLTAQDAFGASFNEDFQITTTLVPAGMTIFDTLQVPITVSAQLRTDSRAAETPPVSGSASADFYNTVHFLSLDTPAEVTWTSESGQFLVPLPPALYLFVSGLIGLAGIARNKPA